MTKGAQRKLALIMKLNQYARGVLAFFRSHQPFVVALAHRIIRPYYSIPLEPEDLISQALYRLLALEMEERFYFQAAPRHPLEHFVRYQLKYAMFDVCNLYTRKNHQIMNNYIAIPDNESPALPASACAADYYFSAEPLACLSAREFAILYELKVIKYPRREVAKRHHLSLANLHHLEVALVQRIKRHHLALPGPN